MSLTRIMASEPGLAISHDPSDPPDLRVVGAGAGDLAAQAPHSWIEILSQGLTYDLAGFLPGPPIALPAIDYRFDAPTRSPLTGAQGLRIVPGANIAAGATTMPVMRGLMHLTCALARELSGLEAVIWPPARSAMGPKYFESIAMAWLDGGPFPAIGLTAFTTTADGEVQSVGLSHWTGQELRIEPSAAADREAATRLAVRLIDQLVMIGNVSEALQFVGPDGVRLIIKPSSERGLLRVMKD